MGESSILLPILRSAIGRSRAADSRQLPVIETTAFICSFGRGFKRAAAPAWTGQRTQPGASETIRFCQRATYGRQSEWYRSPAGDVRPALSAKRAARLCSICRADDDGGDAGWRNPWGSERRDAASTGCERPRGSRAQIGLSPRRTIGVLLLPNVRDRWVRKEWCNLTGRQRRRPRRPSACCRAPKPDEWCNSWPKPAGPAGHSGGLSARQFPHGRVSVPTYWGVGPSRT